MNYVYNEVGKITTKEKTYYVIEVYYKTKSEFTPSGEQILPIFTLRFDSKEELSSFLDKQKEVKINNYYESGVK